MLRARNGDVCGTMAKKTFVEKLNMQGGVTWYITYIDYVAAI